MRGAGIAFVHDRRILLLRRSRLVTDAGKWNLPGGTIEPKEVPLQTARREATEEAGPLPPYEITKACPAKSYMTYVAPLHRSFRPRLNWESDDHRWVTIAEAKDLPLTDSLRVAIEDRCFEDVE